MHRRKQKAVQRRGRRPASGADSRSRREIRPQSWRGAGAVSEFVSIAPTVKLGKDVKLSKFINLYGCEIGDETKIGAFAPPPNNPPPPPPSTLSTHTSLCEGAPLDANLFLG